MILEHEIIFFAFLAGIIGCGWYLLVEKQLIYQTMEWTESQLRTININKNKINHWNKVLEIAANNCTNRE